ncbi:MAG: M20/M25/M40 family metallo-hydrolase [Planctomycetaceae bacterium]|nr:M20/M25/M40 family metallo-hydrolase [Planctomycetaceae bacterium]
MIDELSLLAALDAPVGFEEPVLKYLAEQLGACCDRVEADVRGNLYAWQGSEPHAPLVMVTAHADEVGFMVTTILESGCLRFTRLGFPTEMVLPGQPVRVLTPNGPIAGVIGVKPGHILSGEAARLVPPVEQLYLDVGASSAAEVGALGIEPGTPVVFHGPLTRTANPKRVYGKAVDNRIGCLCVLEVARRMAALDDVAANLAFVITVEEEVGLRGAEVAAAHVQPDVLLAIDTVPSGGTPELRADELPWNIGKGPLLKVRETRGLSTHGPLRDLLRRVAAKHNIPYQLIVDTAGITDGSSAQQASGKIAAAVLGLARRYSHSASELLDIGDAEQLVDWLVATIPEFSSRELLLRYHCE